MEKMEKEMEKQAEEALASGMKLSVTSSKKDEISIRDRIEKTVLDIAEEEEEKEKLGINFKDDNFLNGTTLRRNSSRKGGMYD